MKGASSVSGTPAKARRTGKPSPSKPLGAVTRRRTARYSVVAVSSLGSRGRTSTSSTVMAGMIGTPLLCDPLGAQALAEPGEDAGEDGDLGFVEVVHEMGAHRAEVVRRG